MMQHPQPISFHNICVDYSRDDLSDEIKGVIENVAQESFLAIRKVMPIDNLIIRIVDNPSLIIPGIGVGGFSPNKEEVLISIDTEFQYKNSSLRQELAPILAHEVHHTNRRRTVGYGSTLLEAIISEGLADHFSIEINGILPPPWSKALNNEDLQFWITKASEIWTDPTYNHSQWFFWNNCINSPMGWLFHWI